MDQNKRITKATCMWCHCHCKVDVVVEDGRFVKIEADKTHPRREVISRTVKACPRARAASDWFYHPDRLNFPLKRAGERGSGHWNRISWEQALDEIATKLKEIIDAYGSEAIATSLGTARTHDEYRGRFFNLLGAVNYIGQERICWCVNHAVSTAIMGWPSNTRIVSPGVTKCVMLIGANPHQSNFTFWLNILEAKKHGSKLIVIDPRYTGCAEKADLWLRLRPGTDPALLLGMINVIIEEDLYDKKFVEKWCYGFDKLAERAREYPTKKVEEITSVPEEKIREAARVYADNKPAMIHSYMGLEHLSSNVQALQARHILPSITGNIDIPGGNVFYDEIIQDYMEDAEIELGEKVHPDQARKQIGGDRFKLMSWEGYDLLNEILQKNKRKRLHRFYYCQAHAPSVFRAMITGKPYPVRALLTSANNPLTAFPNTKLVYKALNRLSLFMVADFFMTPSAELADYVLPIASWLERPAIFSEGGTRPGIDAGQAALPHNVPGQYDRRRDYAVWRGLGMRLGQKEYWPWPTLEEAYDFRLSRMGYTLEQFMKEKGGFDILPFEYKNYEKVGFGTNTGKLELYSTVFEKLGYDPLPYYEEPAESHIRTPELAEEYPLVLITGGRFQPVYHSEWHQVESARDRHPHPIVQLHPQTATDLGIPEGHWVWIETPRGRVRMKCRYSKKIDPGVVHGEHGWWFPELPGEKPWLHGVWESNINILTNDDPEQCNTISGGWPLRAALCKVYKAKSY